MISLSVRLVESLSSYTDAQLDRVTRDSCIFLDRRWLRLMDALDLEPLVLGPARLRYAVAHLAGEPVAICPFLTTRSASLQITYSFDKTFFTGFQDDLVRINPAAVTAAGWLGRATRLYRALASASGALPRAWLLAASPLSFRSGIAAAELAPAERGLAFGAVIAALEEAAREERAGLWFTRVPGEDATLRGALSARGFAEVFMTHDHLIDDAGEGIDHYLQKFRANARSKHRREMARARKAGLRFETTTRLGDISLDLSRQYATMYRKYGADHFAHPPAFWAALERHLGPAAEALLCYQGAELTRFSVLLHKQDLWAYRGGAVAEAGDGAAYFNVSYYEPIRRAAELRARRLWLGPGSFATKRHRGATRHPLYSYLRFPSRRAAALLRPYVTLFGAVAERELEETTQPSGGLKEAS